MANEIYKTATFRANKGGARVEFSGTKNFDMSGDDMLSGTQVIGTSSETVDLGDISGAPVVLVIKNLDSTNFVEIGGDSGLTVFKLKIPAGDFVVIQPSSATIYAKADTADVRIQTIAAEA